MRYFKLLSLLLMFTLISASAGAAELKFAYVDLQEALTKSEPGKKAREIFQKDVEKQQKDLDERQKELKNMNEELEKQAYLFSEETKAKKEKELKEKIQEFQVFYQESRKKLQEKDAQLTSKLIADLRTIIEKIGKDGGYSIIFQNSDGNMIYADDKMDLTDKVIKTYNKSVK